MFLVSSCSCLCPIHWSKVLSREWRCSWNSADRRCSNYIWVINNFIAYRGAFYIRGFKVILQEYESENVVCQLSAILIRSHCVKRRYIRYISLWSHFQFTIALSLWYSFVKIELYLWFNHKRWFVLNIYPRSWVKHFCLASSAHLLRVTWPLDQGAGHFSMNTIIMIYGHDSAIPLSQTNCRVCNPLTCLI